MIKGSIQEEDIKTVNIYAPNKDLIQTYRKIKLFRQEKVKRIQYHKTSFTTNVYNNPRDLYSQEIKEKKMIYKNKPQTI